jgi:hypothetical protein
MSKYYGDKELFASPEVSQYGSHMVMTNVVKQTRIKYINLDTKFADDYVNNTTNASNLATYNQSSYIFTLPQRINDVKSIKVQTSEVPMTFYNISAFNGNNVMSIQVGATTPIIIRVPDGNYDKASLINAIGSQFTSNSISGFSITNSIVNNKTTFSNSNGSALTLNFAINSDGTFDKYNFKNKLGWTLGFIKPSYIIAQTSGSLISESIMQLNWKYLYLALDEFSNGNQNSFASQMSSSLINKNIIAKIVLNKTTYDFGTILGTNVNFGNLMSDTRTYNGKIDIQKIKLQLLNEYGNVVNLNGADFSVGIQIEYE